jgi:hypothetical protein
MDVKISNRNFPSTVPISTIHNMKSAPPRASGGAGGTCDQGNDDRGGMARFLP